MFSKWSKKKSTPDRLVVEVAKDGGIFLDIEVDSSDPKSIENLCAAIYGLVHGQFNVVIYDFLKSSDDPQIVRMADILDAVAKLDEVSKQEIPDDIAAVHPFRVFSGRQQ